MISRQGILHIPLSQYAFANSETNLTIRIRVTKNDLDRCVLWYGDRVQPTNPVIFSPIEMNKIMSDKYFDYYDATFETAYNRVCYYFELDDCEEKLYYYADMAVAYLPTERSEFYQYPFIRREEIIKQPEWFEKAVIYNIFPDSFASGKRVIRNQEAKLEWKDGLMLKSRLGGTIKGVTENLDYIQDMGYTCIYMNPIFTAAEYHKYDLLDYYHISPSLGTDEDFRELVNEIHRRGMHIILDGVFNHCSWYFPQFSDVVEHGEDSKYKDWFYDLTFPVIRPEDTDTIPNYSCFAYERKMPKMNTSNPEVREYFTEVGKYWIEEFHIDGWRLDVANEVDREFWRAFRRGIKEVKSDAVMIGEIWESAETWLQGDMFDSTMNYDFRKNCRDFFGMNRISVMEFHDRIVKMLLRYRTETLRGQMNLLDSHDVNRFLSYCQGDVRRLKIAEVFLFMMPGIPCVFYGDELCMDGDVEYTFRAPMPWERIKEGIVDFFHKLITTRKENEVLIDGDFRLVELNEKGLYVYSRQNKEFKILVCLNNGEGNFDVNSYLDNGDVILADSFEHGILGEYGYVVIRTRICYI